MRKITSILILAVLVAAFAPGCGGGKQVTEKLTPNQAAAQAATEITAENASAEADKLLKELQ